MDKIQKSVQKFKKRNGNREVPLDHLVIYFNEERKKEIGILFKKIDKLPCGVNANDITELKTTIKNVKKALIVGIPAVIGLIGLMKVL